MLAATLLTAARAQTPGYRPPPKYVTDGKADQAEGARVLNDFHQAGISGNYWLGFELRVMPRQGPDTVVAGQILGTRNNQGPLTRLTLGSRHWLIQSGPQASTWIADNGAKSQAVSAAQTLDPLAGTDLTVFDLQMPFFYWTDFVYEGLARIRGRPAHSFVLYPPATLSTERPDLTGVRIFIDTQFQQAVQGELLGAKGAVEKTISILDLKKIGDRWIFKSIDFRNNLTRGKTRLTVNTAAFDLVLPPETFDPGSLGSPFPQIPSVKIQHL